MSKMLNKLREADNKRNDMARAKQHVTEKKKKGHSLFSKETQQARRSRNYTMSEAELQELITRQRTTSHDGGHDYAGGSVRRKDRRLFILLFILAVIVASPLLYERYGPSVREYVQNSKGLASDFTKIKATVRNFIEYKLGALFSASKDTFSTEEFLPALLGNFNVRNVLEDNISAVGVSLSLVPRIVDTDGDYALRIHRAEQTEGSIIPEVVMSVEPFMRQQYTYFEFWMKTDTERGNPLNMSIILHSGFAIAKYSSFIPQSGWKRYVIPLADFTDIENISAITKVSLVIEPGASLRKGWDIYLDDMYLTPQEAPHEATLIEKIQSRVTEKIDDLANEYEKQNRGEE